MTPTETARAALKTALESECAVMAPNGEHIAKDGKHLWCGLSLNQRGLVRAAVRAETNRWVAEMRGRISKPDLDAIKGRAPA